MTKKLFEPFQLRNLTFRNRLWVTPMCQDSVIERDGVATAWHVVHYGGFARSGVGAIIVESTGVVPEGRITPNDLGLWNDTQQEALKPIAEFAHSQGAAIGIQLSHAGRKASVWPEWDICPEGSVSENDGGWQTVAPSAVALPGLADPLELTIPEIGEIVSAFRASARRAIDAGFDFVEIHAAHGYLLHEFLSPLSNMRTDRYGGSPDNRARLVVEVVDAIRIEVGEEVPVLVRVSATDWVDGGLTLDDTVRLAITLREHGVDLIDVSTGGNVQARIPAGPGYQVPFAAGVRERAKTPTAAVGLITEPFQAEQILVTGQADVVLVGRKIVRDPNFVRRAAQALRYELPYIPRPDRESY
ncbi:NADH:flavin oxidoreductase/NADH oxidase [Leucobacter japonicus]|uniref:NADH:flavin oxidoreductase/NADH oxidase n=1 Tax=Leucobacter japonicus TaxID=1461259 RepID=UPI0006A79C27|nr:NADH:flavin oxidoreductase/NADH oxidase [Leucobacter japonicus]